MNNRNLPVLLILLALAALAPGCARWRLPPSTGLGQLSGGADAPSGGRVPPPGSPRASGVQLATHDEPVPQTRPGTPPGAGQASPLSEEDLCRNDPALTIARLSEGQSDHKQAQRLYRQYIQKNPSHPMPYHRLGVMAARQTKFDDAESFLMKALELAPPTTELLRDIGYFYYLTGRLDEAERYLEQALAQSPSDEAACNNLALVHGAKGDFKQSIAYFRRVNDEAKSHANLAYVLSQQGDIEHARAEYLHALTVDNQLRTAANALLQIEDVRRLRHTAAGNPAPLGNPGGHPAPPGHPGGDSGRQFGPANQPAAQFAQRMPEQMPLPLPQSNSPGEEPQPLVPRQNGGPPQNQTPRAWSEKPLMPLPAFEGEAQQLLPAQPAHEAPALLSPGAAPSPAVAPTATATGVDANMSATSAWGSRPAVEAIPTVAAEAVDAPASKPELAVLRPREPAPATQRSSPSTPQGEPQRDVAQLTYISAAEPRDVVKANVESASHLGKLLPAPLRFAQWDKNAATAANDATQENAIATAPLIQKHTAAAVRIGLSDGAEDDGKEQSGPVSYRLQSTSQDRTSSRRKHYQESN